MTTNIIIDFSSAYWYIGLWASLVAQTVKNFHAMWETWFQSLGWDDPMVKGVATHSSILAWRIHGQRSLAGYSSWGHKELDMTERIILSPRLSLSIICWKFIQGFACINSSFLFMADSSWCGCTLVCLTIHPLKDTGVVFHLGPLRVKIFMNIYV